MNSTTDLKGILSDILDSNEVYFQSPENKKMSYPAIIFSLSSVLINHANDAKYKKMKAYDILLIDKNPDSEFFDSILDLPYCSFDRHYVSDNLNHFVFNLYF